MQIVPTTISLNKLYLFGKVLNLPLANLARWGVILLLALSACQTQSANPPAQVEDTVPVQITQSTLDNDGDLDIVVNDLRSPAQLFENQLCGGSGLEVELSWPGSGNTRGLGAQLVLLTSAGSYTRDVRAGSGYLSGDPARVHFGFPVEAVLQRLDIRWPDGSVSQINNLAPQTLLTIQR